MTRHAWIVASAAALVLARPVLAGEGHAHPHPHPHPHPPAAAPAEAAAPAARPASLAIGAAAPATDVEMTGVDMKPRTIASVKGEKGTLVLFTCNHCPYVKAWQDRIVEIGNGAAELGIGVIAINSNDPGIVPGDSIGAMREVSGYKKFAFPYVVDAGSAVARAFGAGRTPEAFLLDAEGRLAYHGAIDDNSEDATKVTRRYLADAIQAVSAGRAVETKETKAIGCSIKFAKAGPTG